MDMHPKITNSAALYPHLGFNVENFPWIQSSSAIRRKVVCEVFIHTYKHTYIHTYTQANTCTSTYTDTCMNMHYIYIHTLTHRVRYIYIRSSSCIFTHTHTHTHRVPADTTRPTGSTITCGGGTGGSGIW